MPDILVPSNVTLWIGIIVVFFAVQILSGYGQKLGENFLRRKGHIPNTRKTDDSEWFNKFIEHHDALTKEIHEFTASLMKIVETMSETNRMLSENQRVVAEKHALMLNDLKRIRNLTEGRK